jgi:two-component system response regulator YesN
VSAYSEFIYAQKAIELGASFYMLKPFSKTEFMDTFTKLRMRCNENQSKGLLLKQSILENMIYGEKQVTDTETITQFEFIPEVVVAMKGKGQEWKQSFFVQFQGIKGFLAPEPIGDVSVYVTSKKNLEILKRKLVQVNIEVGEELVYGIGISNNIKNSFINATKQLNEQDESIVNKSMQYIQENYFKALTIADVALAVHVSSSHLNRLLKKETSKTFTELLLNVRVNKAKELLNQNFNIEVVSDMIGFNSSAYFAVSFKKFTGVSPSQYRKEIG